MTAYAQANGLEAITPIGMFALFGYIDGSSDLDDPTCNRVVVEAVIHGERTTTFRMLQETVRENQYLRR
jgi:hypothetical protein